MCGCQLALHLLMHAITIEAVFVAQFVGFLLILILICHLSYLACIRSSCSTISLAISKKGTSFFCKTKTWVILVKIVANITWFECQKYWHQFKRTEKPCTRRTWEYLEIVWSTAYISFKTLKARDEDHELTNAVPTVKAKLWKSKMFVQSINLISCS